jgi:hypothetical protein
VVTRGGSVAIVTNSKPTTDRILRHLAHLVAGCRYLGLMNADGGEISGQGYARQPVQWLGPHYDGTKWLICNLWDLAFTIPAGETVTGWIAYGTITGGTEWARGSYSPCQFDDEPDVVFVVQDCALTAEDDSVPLARRVPAPRDALRARSRAAAWRKQLKAGAQFIGLIDKDGLELAGQYYRRERVEWVDVDDDQTLALRNASPLTFNTHPGETVAGYGVFEAVTGGSALVKRVFDGPPGPAFRGHGEYRVTTVGVIFRT